VPGKAARHPFGAARTHRRYPSRVLLHAEVDIDATSAQVWSVLTDLDSYQHWNPFIVHASGELRVGGTLVNVIRFRGGERTFTPTVLEVDAGRELRWLGKHRIPGMFSGEHSFTLIELGPQRVRLEQSEKFKGLAVPLLAKDLREDTLPGFEAMNQALRERAEAL
jgi:hypothetical protein